MDRRLRISGDGLVPRGRGGGSCCGKGLDLAVDVSEDASEVAAVVAIDVEHAAGGEEAAGEVGRCGLGRERGVDVVSVLGRVPDCRGIRVVFGGGVIDILVPEGGDGCVNSDRRGVLGELFKLVMQVVNGGVGLMDAPVQVVMLSARADGLEERFAMKIECVGEAGGRGGGGPLSEMTAEAVGRQV